MISRVSLLAVLSAFVWPDAMAEPEAMTMGRTPDDGFAVGLRLGDYRVIARAPSPEGAMRWAIFGWAKAMSHEQGLPNELVEEVDARARRCLLN